MSEMTSVRKVLVVDDDPVIGKSFHRVLSGKGYAVITASDGEEALQKLSAEAYDVVFADIKMPGISGIEVAKRLKASQPWLPVVIVTGYGTEENERRAKDVGVSGFLRKPLTPEMIVDAAEVTLAAPKEEPAEVTEVVAAMPLVADTVEASALGTKEEVKRRSKLADVALFIVAPFIGLAYLFALPFVGLGVLAWSAVKTLMKKRETASPARQSALKRVATLVAAPFIGLAFVIALPVLGLGLLAWFGVRALISFGANVFGKGPERD